ncbi:Major facilitator superfamily [Paraburkholderia piptadeniae]|uniref:Major facilitator superfamily n=1 Tax=Paraburkholderia piptadeniae TaxID=1701573 RepID=A0A1N7RII5_9BURK|nr:MFS transporter [Paraburkholderia piptadeniae]SIT34930.1 Major facilitator superfamily [Paraburkholderia piptadeniae]
MQPVQAKAEMSSGALVEGIFEDTVARKVSLRIVPFLLVCYVVSYLDRINIGFAKFQMQDTLGFSDAIYGMGAGVFFIGYMFFEIPSNVFMKRIGAKKTLSRIMLLWGLVGCCMALVSTPMQFYVCRFLLGACEAGFAPGVIYYISCWFPKRRQGKALGVFFSGIPIAGLIGGPASGWVLTHFDGLTGMHGWQWMFVLQAAPAILLGVIAYCLLDDDISRAKWLSSDERRYLEMEIASEIDVTRSGHAPRIADFGDVRLYLMALSYFTFICGTYALSFWLPSMLKNAGLKDNLSIGLYSAIPFAVSAVGMVLLCKSSDRSGERRWHTALSAIVGGAALAAIPFVPNTLFCACTLLAIAATTIFATISLFWTMPSEYFAGSPGAAGSIALINSIALTGGFLSPFVIGWIKTATGSLVGGLYLISAVLAIGGILLLVSVPKHLVKRHASV